MFPSIRSRHKKNRSCKAQSYFYHRSGDDRDENLQEWEESVPENDGNDDDRRKRKGISRKLITAGILVVLIGGILAVRKNTETCG